MMNYYCSCKEIHEFRNGVSYEGFERSQNKEKEKEKKKKKAYIPHSYDCSS